MNGTVAVRRDESRLYKGRTARTPRDLAIFDMHISTTFSNMNDPGCLDRRDSSRLKKNYLSLVLLMNGTVAVRRDESRLYKGRAANSTPAVILVSPRDLVYRVEHSVGQYHRFLGVVSPFFQLIQLSSRSSEFDKVVL